MKSCIYAIINKKNNKLYIGSTVDYKIRLKVHINKLIKNEHHSILLQRAFNKYGIKMFKFKILEFVENDKLLEKEQYYLDFYESYNKRKGYNICNIAGRRVLISLNDAKEIKMLLIENYNKFNNIMDLYMHIFLKYKYPESNIRVISEGRHYYSSFLNGGLNNWITRKNGAISFNRCKEVKKMLIEGFTKRYIEKELNISTSVIQKIRTGKHVYSKELGKYSDWVPSIKKELTLEDCFKVKELILLNKSRKEISKIMSITYDEVIKIKYGNHKFSEQIGCLKDWQNKISYRMTLNIEQLLQIKKLLLDKHKTKNISKIIGISERTIIKIKSGKHPSNEFLNGGYKDWLKELEEIK